MYLHASFQKVRTNQHPDSKRTVPAPPHPSASQPVRRKTHYILDTHSQDCQELRGICALLIMTGCMLTWKPLLLTLEQRGFELHGSTYMQMFGESKLCSATRSEVGWICGCRGTVDLEGCPTALCCSRGNCTLRCGRNRSRAVLGTNVDSRDPNRIWHHHQAHRQEPLLL